MSNQANDMYWVTAHLADMSRELATPEADHDFISDNFDALYNHMAEHGDKVEGGFVFRMDDGRGISVGVVLLNVDEIGRHDSN